MRGRGYEPNRIVLFCPFGSAGLLGLWQTSHVFLYNARSVRWTKGSNALVKAKAEVKTLCYT